MTGRGPAVTVTVPGKVMLVGEYTVLTGGAALAVTIDRHLTVRARALPAGAGVQVGSSLWDAPRRTAAGAPPVGEPLLDAAAHATALFGATDVAVRVDSELDPRHGTGSSSALRLGTLLAVQELTRVAARAPKIQVKDELWLTARAAHLLQRGAQATASGYDVATQLLGGLVRFRAGDDDDRWPAAASRLPDAMVKALASLAHIFVGGRGAATAPVMATTRAWLASGDRARRLAAAADELHTALEAALRAVADDRTVRALVRATAAHRRCLADAPTFPRAVAAVLDGVPGLDESWSYKTTGAGGEDALLVVGTLAAVQDSARALRRAGWERLAAGFESMGVRVSRRGDHD